MQDYAQFLENPAKSTSDFMAMAALRYAIHVAVAQLDNEDDLRGLLSVAQAAKEIRARGNA